MDRGDGRAVHRAAPGVPRPLLRLPGLRVRAQAGAAAPTAAAHRRHQPRRPAPVRGAGDGWFGGSSSPSRAEEIITGLQQRRAEIGGSRLEITMLTGWGQGFDPELVKAYAAAGVDRLMVTPWSSSRTAREGIERFAADAGLGEERSEERVGVSTIWRKEHVWTSRARPSSSPAPAGESASRSPWSRPPGRQRRRRRPDRRTPPASLGKHRRDRRGGRGGGRSGLRHPHRPAPAGRHRGPRR